MEDDVSARLHKAQSDVQELSNRLNAAKTELAKRQASYENADRSVQAVVRGDGSVIRLRIAPGTLRKGAAVTSRLGAELVTAINCARRKATLESKDLLISAVGDEPTVDNLIGSSSYDAALAAEAAAPRSAAAPAQPAPAPRRKPARRSEPVEDDDYFEEVHLYDDGR